MVLHRAFSIGAVCAGVACGGAVEAGTDASTSDGATEAGIDAKAPDGAGPACLESLATWCARMGCLSRGPTGYDDMPRWCASAGSFGKRVSGIAVCDLYVNLEIAPPDLGLGVNYYYWYDRTTGSLVAVTDGPARVCYAGTAPRDCGISMGVGTSCP